MRGKYIQNNNLTSKLCLKYHHRNHMNWNKMTYCVVTAHQAGCTALFWHCLKKLVLNTIRTEPKVFMPQLEAQIVTRKMLKAVSMLVCNFSMLLPAREML